MSRNPKQSELPRYSLLSASRWTVVLSIALATADNFAEPDLWIHMLTGQTILRTGHIPRVEAYSYSAAGSLWRNHEWLSQVALAFLYAHFGVFGLKILKLLVASILILALAIGISTTGAAARVQRLTLILSAVALSPYIQFRPQLFSFMMLSVLMTVIAIEVYGRDAMLWPLIPMFALWANFHGGYIVGLGAMGIATSVMFVQGWFGDADRMTSARRLALVTLGCAAATLFNPFGVGLWTGVAHSVNDPLIRKVMNDWVPLTKLMLSDLAGIAFAVASVRRGYADVWLVCRGSCDGSGARRFGSSRGSGNLRRGRLLCRAKCTDGGAGGRNSTHASCEPCDGTTCSTKDRHPA